ncbi:cyclic pyranopterin monophosphate synthase MoaC [Sulfobacillus harzensis]|uniref:cyclic pyranopterin monophosphate synthase MoaC n=1 Tax=Sulfobacillus harzensis TaxID=2729629 RepID=UPI0023B1C5FE|nr:cyclic pyranopterin monophosphate synthase MoaC [Sulfobacillus harzensis]
MPHLDPEGRVHMVSVGEKDATQRLARAEGTLRTRPQTVRLVAEGRAPKGDVLAVARVAAIMAVKRTAEWIPLAHPIPITGVSADIKMLDDGFLVVVTVATVGPTGVEMEALTGVSAALLTLYDMLKAQERGMVIEQVRLMEKRGGRSGTYQREEG